jgi:two-component system cell cycle sensor histidine kinase/response regulator CckA
MPGPRNPQGRVAAKRKRIGATAPRRKEDRALRESERRYRLLFEKSPLAIWVYDTETLEFLDINEAAVRLYGFGRDEFLSMTIKDIRPPEEIPALLADFVRNPLGHRVGSVWRHRRRDGTDILVEVASHPLDFGGRPARIVLAKDVTEHHRAEDALRESEERYRVVAETATDGIITMNERSEIVFANRALENMFGYPAGELTGRSMTLLMPESFHDRHRAGIRRYLETGKRRLSWAAIRLPGRRKDGAEIPLELSFGEYVREGKHFFTGIVRDISERERAEQELSAQHKFLRKVIDTDPNLVFAKDWDGRFTLANQAVANVYGTTVEELIGKSDADFNPKQDEVESFIRDDREVMMSGRPKLISEEPVTNARTGVTHWFQTIKVPLSPTGEGRLQVLGVSTDITTRRQLGEQLLQAQKMEAIGQLAGGIAHDFNNLLTSVAGYTELLLGELPESDPGHEYAKEIRGAARRAAALTQQLLAFSRRQVLEPRVLNLNVVVGELERMLRRLIGENIELKTSLQEELWRVKADSDQLGQAILNLVLNARDAMARGGQITVETANIVLGEEFVSHHPTVCPGPHVLLAVSDTGGGIDRETQAHLFEPFFTTKGRGKGTGLGLSTTYGIIKQSGGSIWVSSEPGQGTTFKIYLPRSEEPLDLPETTSSDGQRRGTETVLLVEDEPEVRRLVEKLLRMQNYTVLAAESPEHTIVLAQHAESPLDLLLTDVMMPGMNGWELAHTLAASRPGLRVLYMSGYTDLNVASGDVLQPGFWFLQKPFTPDTLACKVWEVLDAAPQQPDSPTAKA